MHEKKITVHAYIYFEEEEKKDQIVLPQKPPNNVMYANE